jgi:tRNA(Ile)-lysidine synthase TilS/MesJ
MNYTIQNFYSILHHHNEPIFLLKNIIPFWKSYKSKWFSHEPINDLDIIHTPYINNTEVNFSLLLHYDQIYRHPTERKVYPELALKFSTQIAFRIIHSSQYEELEDWQKIFTLLTIRHNPELTLKRFVLNKIYKELNLYNIVPNEINPDFKYSSTWLRFLEATIYDIHKHTPITQEVNRDINPDIFNHILERKITYYNKSIQKRTYPYDKLAVSLSGGVDSIVLAYMYKPDYLLHVCYHNRSECQEEIDFLNYFAYKICHCPLFICHIDTITRIRNTQFREVYERVTRNIRFGFYKAFHCPVILGHNYDDSLENIFTNLSKRTHYENLFGMTEISNENGVTILRPFINTTKKEIHSYAELYSLPHLKNSTPSWSKRGQLRDNLIPFIEQYDPNILKNLSHYIHEHSHLHTEWTHTINNYCREIQKTTNTFSLPYNNIFIRNYKNHSFWIEIWKFISLKKFPSHKSIKNMISLLHTNSRIILTPNLHIKLFSDNIILYIIK